MNESGKVAFRKYHDWILPKKILLGILIFSCVFLIIGVILLAIGGSTNPGGISAVGAVLTGFGGCGFMILFLLCLHAYFVFYENDQSTQTWETVTSDITIDGSDFPAYAIVQKPSALKDDTLKKNGKPVKKKVTLPPYIETERGNKAPVINTVTPSIQQQPSAEQYEYPTYMEPQGYSKHGHGYIPIQGQGHSPQFAIHSEQSPQMRSLPESCGQQYPNQYPQDVYPGLRNQTDYPPQCLPQMRVGYDDDYDNTVESTPMMTQPINAKNLCYKPDSDLPEPQPLVYPSAKRPMVFEQTSSSKMSIYDNVVLFSGKDA